MKDLKDIQIKEYDAIEFHNNLSPRIKVKPMYFEKGFSPCETMYGRAVILKKLLDALTHLPNNWGILLWDVYRPRAVQAKLFEWMKEEVRRKHFYFKEEDIEQEAKKYISPPSQVGEEYCPPHLSGGAVDLTLYDLDTQKELFLGTEFDDCSKLAHTDYFDKHVAHNKEEVAIKERRAILKNAMISAGFTTYEYEWWHYDYGNSFWSDRIGLQPLFGPLFGDEEWPR